MLYQKFAKLLLGLGIMGLVSCQAVDKPTLNTNNTIKIPDNTSTGVLVKDIMPQVYIVVDSDGDGVEDATDQCPNTSASQVHNVDERGCHFIMGPDTGLKMEYRAFYEAGKSELTDQYITELGEIAQKMIEYENAVILIEGHISTYESQSNNISLAQARADYIKNYLILVYGIDSSRIKTNAYGDERPIADDGTEEGQRINQRVYALVNED